MQTSELIADQTIEDSGVLENAKKNDITFMQK
jgi:hypothetical protein